MGIRFRETRTPKASWAIPVRGQLHDPGCGDGRTADSVVVICQTGVGRFYYKGAGLQNGLSVEIDDPV